jgi:MerR family transcriptional regulator, light-induced transcriptional regulator
VKNEKFNHDVTYIAIENFSQRSFEIAYEVFHNLKHSADFSVKEFVLALGETELYESLMYHKDMINSILLSKNYDLLEEFFVWKYSVYQSKNINVDCFLVEYDLWKHSITHHLYQSHSSEITLIYDYLLLHHEEYKLKALTPKKIVVLSQHQKLFDNLLHSLLSSNQEEFYKIIEANLPLFNNDIFSFIEQVINPLMYKVGNMWQYNQLSVAKEHLATSLTNEIIEMFFIKITLPPKRKERVIISTVGDESHNLGIKIVGKFINACGFEVQNLVSKISSKELISSIYELQPDLLVLSATLPSNIATLQQIVDELKSDAKAFPGLIIVGGQALFGDNRDITIQGADFCSKNLEELKQFLIRHYPIG